MIFKSFFTALGLLAIAKADDPLRRIRARRYQGMRVSQRIITKTFDIVEEQSLSSRPAQLKQSVADTHEILSELVRRTDQ